MKEYNGYLFNPPKPEGFTMGLYWAETFMPTGEVSEFLKVLDKIPLQPATIQSGYVPDLGKGILDKKIRDSSVGWLNCTGLERLFERLETVVKESNKGWSFDIWGIDEPLQFSVYGIDQFYEWHLDIGVGEFARRKITGIIPLNEMGKDYEGGAVEVHCIDGLYTISPQPGSITLFPSFLAHRVLPVTKGERHSLVFWVSGPPFK